jgi:hypothetical protein
MDWIAETASSSVGFLSFFIEPRHSLTVAYSAAGAGLALFAVADTAGSVRVFVQSPQKTTQNCRISRYGSGCPVFVRF